MLSKKFNICIKKVYGDHDEKIQGVTLKFNFLFLKKKQHCNSNIRTFKILKWKNLFLDCLIVLQLHMCKRQNLVPRNMQRNLYIFS